MKLYNSVITKFNNNITNSNTDYFTTSSTTQSDIITDLKNASNTSKGIYSGDYSEWISSSLKYLIKDVNENVYYGINDSNEQLLFTDISSVISNEDDLSLSNINNNLSSLPELYQMYRLSTKTKV